jgi:CxxC motif-containing protein (DUF1111 family)
MSRRRHSWLGGWVAVALLLSLAAVPGRASQSADVSLSTPAAAVAADDATARAGGDTTVFDAGPSAYGRALANLDRLRWNDLAAGKARFVREWPHRGPWADAASCADCHFHDGRGPRPDATHIGLTHLLRLGRSSGEPDLVYGAQLRRIGYGVAAPGQFTVRWEPRDGRYPSGERYTLRRPIVQIDQLAHGPLDRSTQLSLRVPPAVFGLGLIEAIREDDILAHADPHDADRDGISGRPQRVRDSATGDDALGRFGWKAAQPSLAAQSAAALRQDLGVAHAGLHASGAGADELISLVRYLRALAVPARRRSTDASIQNGERLFAQIGCGGCHRTRITTGQMPGWPELSGQTIHPYTDLLLHDMGPHLADGVTEGLAAGREWRTPPLWGLGLLPIVSGEMRLLHDGRARSAEEAILWHGGEAEAARRRFIALPKPAREALTMFLAAL